jgi:hypothetical protein
MLNGTLFKKRRFYRYSHSIDAFDPSQLMSSGAAQYYTPNARPVLQGWLDTISRFPNVMDDESLDYTYNFVISRNLIRASWWGKDYCRYPWWIHTRPVIDHPQLPIAIEPSRKFKSVTGRDRYKVESVQSRSPPVTRNYLIDTKRKRFLRLDYGGVAVMGRFAQELWIDGDSKPSTRLFTRP